MKEILYCPYCGAQLSAEQKFCGNCGKPKPEEPTLTFEIDGVTYSTIPESELQVAKEEEQQPQTTNVIEQKPIEEDLPLNQSRSKQIWLGICVAIILFIFGEIIYISSNEKETEVDLSSIVESRDELSDNSQDNEFISDDNDILQTHVEEKSNELSGEESDKLVKLKGYEDMGYKVTHTLLTESDLQGCSKRDLKIMRNWIFAKHGYRFKTADMREFFEQFSWYEGRYDDVTNMLSDTERSNVEFIKRHE